MTALGWQWLVTGLSVAALPAAARLTRRRPRVVRLKVMLAVMLTGLVALCIVTAVA